MFSTSLEISVCVKIPPNGMDFEIADLPNPASIRVVTRILAPGSLLKAEPWLIDSPIVRLHPSQWLFDPFSSSS